MLSACETGLGKEKRGEGVMGLTRAFMYAGAPTVGVSLWSVADKSTADLMTDFYRRLLAAGDGSSSGALRAAQLSMIFDEEIQRAFLLGAVCSRRRLEIDPAPLSFNLVAAFFARPLVVSASNPEGHLILSATRAQSSAPESLHWCLR